MPGLGRARAGVSLPSDALVPPLGDPAQISGIGALPSIVHRAPPDLTPLQGSSGAVRSSSALPASLGTTATPQLTVVEGAVTIDDAVSGAGVLYATGHLRIEGRLDFTGVVAANGGIEIGGAGELHVCGALWAAGSPALDARGRGEVRASTDAIAMASRIASLPARARVIAIRELF